MEQLEITDNKLINNKALQWRQRLFGTDMRITCFQFNLSIITPLMKELKDKYYNSLLRLQDAN